MVLRVVGLPALFRPATSHVYPPFKRGRYMEEYVYDVLVTQGKGQEMLTDWIYVPVFWTNLQNHPGFSCQRGKYQMLLNHALSAYPAGSRFFTCVQHDDGPDLTLPADCRVYGACTGSIPLPLIYEDTEERLLSAPRVPLENRDILISFVGTVGTHPVREAARRALEGCVGVHFSSRGAWSASVPEEDARRFVEWTGRSRFCLAPRGYGRSSFRFFEAMLLDVVPVYVWDDEEWLPYKDVDYRRFCVSVHVSEVDGLYDRLAAIGYEEYQGMVEEIRRVRRWFLLEGMVEWLMGDLEAL